MLFLRRPDFSRPWPYADGAEGNNSIFPRTENNRETPNHKSFELEVLTLHLEALANQLGERADLQRAGGRQRKNAAVFSQTTRESD